MSKFNELCQVAILAGGMGTRLRSRTGTLPKPMACVLGRPVLEHQIALCKRNGFKRVALLVHYEHEVIRSHFGSGARWGVELTYVVEQDARGTAGALRDALDNLDDRFLVLYGDTYADVDLRALWGAHERSGAHATLLLHPNDHPQDSDLVELGEQGQVLGVRPYPHAEGAVYANLVNAALYVLERKDLAEMIPQDCKSDLAKHTFPAMLAAGRSIHGYVTPEYIKDMGTPERLDKVARDIVMGLPERLSGRQLRPAVFLDRDGTLNEEVNHLSSPGQLSLIPGVGDAVRALNRAGVLAVGVTNQPVVARGDVSWEGLRQIHAHLDHLLGEGRAYLDRMYVCPHHPDRGFAGEVSELKFECDCRKPKPGLIDAAVKELRIDRANSWMVGDTTSDVRAGRLAGVRTVLLRTGHAGQDAKYPDEPDYVMPNLTAAIDWILQGHAAMAKQLLEVAACAVTARLVLIAGVARSGKSSAARVLSELLSVTGRTVHVLSLDGWLKPATQRSEGAGVESRYDMIACKAVLAPLWAGEPTRHWLDVPVYERQTRDAANVRTISVGPEDLIILEGVPSLMDADLVGASQVRVFMRASESVLSERFNADYAWRSVDASEVQALFMSRQQDEWPQIAASARNATHTIDT
jgi:histidinol-phosphate phosphatase family protein